MASLRRNRLNDAKVIVSFFPRNSYFCPSCLTVVEECHGRFPCFFQFLCFPNFSPPPRQVPIESFATFSPPSAKLGQLDSLKRLIVEAQQYHKKLEVERSMLVLQTKQRFNEYIEVKGNIRVFVRIRPIVKGEDKA